ncbi:hypothetical protein [Gemmatimonas groenlandica]|nr:hypothetical protein [Gemmatimonas groenlandica]
MFEKLAIRAEAERFQELRPLPFGVCGRIYDKYGMQWIFSGDGAQ